jgi:MFS family permease
VRIYGPCRPRFNLTITRIARMTVSALDQDHSGTQPKKTDEGRDYVTPLPWGTLLVVLLVQFADPMTGMVIFPFINQFVGETGITGGDDTRTGYFAGIIVRTWFCNHVHCNFETKFQESMFFFAKAVTVVFWGMASDRFGRRSVLIFGPLGLSIAMLGFGASKQFSSLVMFRLFQGVFNGNMGMSPVRYN